MGREACIMARQTRGPCARVTGPSLPACRAVGGHSREK